MDGPNRPASHDFLCRYVARFGFLCRQAGTAFHFLQGFWYRHLVGAKVAEVRRHMADTGSDVVASSHAVFGIDATVGNR